MRQGVSPSCPPPPVIMPCQLFYYPSNASLAPHILLEEIGAPFELVRVDREHEAHKSQDYLAINPAGVIPALVDGEVRLGEAAAICLYLADKHPEANLIPPLQSAARAQCYRWLVYLTNTVQAELLHYFYPDRLGGEHAALIQQRASQRLLPMLAILDAQIAASGGPYLQGKVYTIADIYLFMMCRWTRNLSHPARSLTHLAAFLEVMRQRPAVMRAHATENLTPPWF